VLQDELVASVQLDAWLAVDALGIELCAEPALGPGAVATRLPGAAYLALGSMVSGVL
jgi:hypothetical protein